MALTDKSVINRVRELTGLSEAELPRPRILALMQDARVQLAREIASSDKPFQRQILRKEFTASLADGVADLSSLTTDDEPILLEKLSVSEVYAEDFTQPLQSLASRSLLSLDRPAVFGYYTLSGDSLYTANVEDGTLTFTAAFVPSFDSITKRELEADYIRILSMMVMPTAKEEAA